jgi:ABC-type multidrug transport system ATPase subunit
MAHPVPNRALESVLDGEPQTRRAALDVSFSDIRLDIKDKKILRGITYRVRPGEILALMGATGSGKTTLLNALSHRIKSSGQITFGGKTWTKSLRSLLAFVEQEDIVYDSLTVRKSLQYTAMLRLPASLNHDQKMQRVEEMIALFKIEKCADTVIGNADERGISGGEKKRLCIATEFLTDPAIVFFDEPTSGLDSTMALMVMHAMRQLANEQKTLLTSIHQPNSQVFAMFDSLLLLKDGGSFTVTSQYHILAHYP